MSVRLRQKSQESKDRKTDSKKQTVPIVEVDRKRRKQRRVTRIPRQTYEDKVEWMAMVAAATPRYLSF